MYRSIMTYKNRLLFYIYLLLLCIHNLNVWGQKILLHSQTNYAENDYDITTIYKVMDNMDIYQYNLLFNKQDGFKEKHSMNNSNKLYTVEIHSRTNAIGIPIEYDDYIENNYYISKTNVNEFWSNESNIQNNSRIQISYDISYWSRNENINISGNYCNDDRLATAIGYDETSFRYYEFNQYDTTVKNSLKMESILGEMNDKCYTILEFRYDLISHHLSHSSSFYYSNDNYNLFTLHWTPEKEQTCFTITYLHRIKSELDIILNITSKDNTLMFSTELQKKNGIQTLKIIDMVLLKDQEYEFSLNMKYNRYINNVPYYTGIWFGLLRIAECSNYDEDIRVLVPVKHDSIPTSFHMRRQAVRNSYDNGLCLNGGYEVKSSKCICPPGFIGKYCETGCGMNSYGLDCKGICSFRSNKMCTGMYMCTKYGCTCPPGLTGPFCYEDCALGKYGADCRQKCSSNCYNNICDKYTGVCSQGCLPGYILPYCREKYAYLINPPTLISTNYESIELDFDFQTNNIKGDNKMIMPKYYQLLYKSITDEQFIYSEIKIINYTATYNKSKEILSDLKSDTIYLVGALLIMDDGNFNDQDIVFGQYRTSCIQPQISNYNIQLISGNNSVYITWDEIISKRLECNVSEYVLTLMPGQLQNNITDIQKIVSSSNSGHQINNLLSGYQYNIQLTPTTVNGPLMASPILAFTTLRNGYDVKIKDIVTKNQNENIIVYWNIVNSHQLYPKVLNNDPVKFMVRYKLKRYLSCSLRQPEIETNWTSITLLNQTSYEIFNTVPNSQYKIQILIADKGTSMVEEENVIYALTSASIPKIEPIIDTEHPMYVTNNSVFVQWKFDLINCSKLNGFFSKFYIELKDINKSILQTDETKQNNITIDNLKANTSYEMKIFIKTHIGYNPDHFLLINFKTKFGSLKSVNDLMVYKKSLKNRMVGIRWAYAETTNLDGFIVSFKDISLTNHQNISVIPLTKCSAWPEYYCHTFYHLNPSNSYTFEIKPKSQDYPQGGKVSSISFNSIDGLPDPPSNIKINEISNTTVNIQWDIPWIFNGVLKTFVINLEEIESLDMSTCCVSATPTEIAINDELPTYNYTITGLNPGSTYSIGVLTMSKSLWYSSPARISVTTLKDNM